MCQWRNHWTQSRSELREMLQSQQWARYTGPGELVYLCSGAVLCQWRNHWTQCHSELTERLQSQQSEPIAQALVSWCIFALVQYCASGGITEHGVGQSWEKGCNPNSLSPLHRPWWAGVSLLWCGTVLVEESLNTASVRAERKAAVPTVWARCTGPGELACLCYGVVLC